MPNDNIEIHEFAVELFNAAVPVGSTVIYTDDRDSRIEVVTRSEAWVLPSGFAVVQFKGKSGSFSLARVRVPVEMIRARLKGGA